MPFLRIPQLLLMTHVECAAEDIARHYWCRHLRVLATLSEAVTAKHGRRSNGPFVDCMSPCRGSGSKGNSLTSDWYRFQNHRSAALLSSQGSRLPVRRVDLRHNFENSMASASKAIGARPNKADQADNLLLQLAPRVVEGVCPIHEEHHGGCG